MVRFGQKRFFLFLQGLATPFFVRLADEIAARGHDVHKIVFSGCDRVFWPRSGAVNYRGTFPEWRRFIAGFLHHRSITDIIVFGDCRPYHRVALALARARGVTVHVFEEGYFRPDWITLERDGTNAYSRLPRDPTAILADAAAEPGLESPPHLVGGGFSRRVRWEIFNQFFLLLLSPFYPHYRSHRSHHPLHELWGWFRRVVIKRPFERHYMRRVSDYVTQPGRRYYLLPLQLETDFQIRCHSTFCSMTEVMRVVMDSFARNAESDALLVIKRHPLDNGLVNFRRRANRIARRLNLQNRVFVIDGGHLPTLLSRSQGVVVVNSTAGLSALHHNRPLAVLGEAVFDLPGLTFQGSLDRFWSEKSLPDQDLFRALRRVVIRRAQINGSFFTKAGIELAIKGALERIGAYPVATPAPQAIRIDLEERGIATANSAV
jgi:capsular polysaccharide export protein